MLKLLLLSFLVSPADGGEMPATPTPVEEGCRVQWGQSKSCNVDFEGDDVYGEVIGPDGSTVLARRGPRFGSMISYRTDWDDRVEMDAEDQ
ncbi:MAG: hypothetical protein KJO07_01970 [Deltaproteobacteria bacterium]|jgi:hypothetical protein|nr:hypothetical protein [Deltaproteobacteria bacterium]